MPNSPNFLRRLHFILAGFLLLALCQFLLGQGASATVVVPLDLSELTKRAEHIVIGSCDKTVSSWDQERKRIFTDITLDIETCLKGSNCPRRLTIRQWGGRVDDIIMKVEGNPRFNSGERVLVFLEMFSAPYYRVIGLSQGKFHLMSREEVWYARRETNGLKFLEFDGRNYHVGRQDRPEEEVELNYLLEAIKSYLPER